MASLPRDGAPSFGAPMPPAEGQWIYLSTPKPHQPLKLLVLSTIGLTCLTHWRRDDHQKGGGRTVPHTVPDDVCYDCTAFNQRPRWHAYLACWRLDTSRYVIADITVHAAQMVPSLNPASDICLRGFNLDLYRVGSSANSPVGARLHGSPKPDAEIPLEFDVRLSLMRLWGLTTSADWRTDPQGRPW